MEFTIGNNVFAGKRVHAWKGPPNRFANIEPCSVPDRVIPMRRPAARSMRIGNG
jgi:hypothetical protein